MDRREHIYATWNEQFFFLDNYQLIIKNKAYSYKASEKGFEKI